MNNLPPFRFKTRETLLAALESQLAVAVAYDTKRVAEHKREEKAYLTFFRARCREALKLDYTEAKARGFLVVPGRYDTDPNGYETPLVQKPVCPSSQAEVVRRAIQQAERLTDLSFPERGGMVVRDRGHYQFFHHVLSWAPPADKADLCGAP